MQFKIKYSGVYRTIYHSFNTKLNSKIVFIHVPKCGGVSVGGGIKNAYGFWYNLRNKGFAGVNHKASKKASEILDEPLYQIRRKILIYTLSQPNNRFVKGHVGINKVILNEFHDDWNFITILRDPVERWYSEYFYNRFKDSDHFATNLELEEYVSSQAGIQNGLKYITYFSGNKNSNRRNIEEAKQNLAKFSIVGILEDLSTFKNGFKSVFGSNLQIPHKNSNPAPRHVREDIPASIHEKVIELCKPDIEIYNWVKEKIEG
jgi:hypothetical protein